MSIDPQTDSFYTVAVGPMLLRVSLEVGEDLQDSMHGNQPPVFSATDLFGSLFTVNTADISLVILETPATREKLIKFGKDYADAYDGTEPWE